MKVLNLNLVLYKNWLGLLNICICIHSKYANILRLFGLLNICIQSKCCFNFLIFLKSSRKILAHVLGPKERRKHLALSLREEEDLQKLNPQRETAEESRSGEIERD